MQTRTSLEGDSNMVRPKELIEGVLWTLQQHPDIPDSASYVGYTPDINSESIKLPVVEVSMGPQVRLREENTDFVGFKTDDNGNQIGRIFEALYTLELNVAVWTAQGSKYSPRDISDSVRDALYSHDIAGPGEPLVHPDFGPIDEVWSFDILEGSHTDDLTTSPTLRRWQQDVSVSASEQYVVHPDEDPVTAININA